MAPGRRRCGRRGRRRATSAPRHPAPGRRGRRAAAPGSWAGRSGTGRPPRPRRSSGRRWAAVGLPRCSPRRSSGRSNLVVQQGRQDRALRADPKVQGSLDDLTFPDCLVCPVQKRQGVLEVLEGPGLRLLENPSLLSLLVDLCLPAVHSVHSVRGTRVGPAAPALPAAPGFRLVRVLRGVRVQCGWTRGGWERGSGGSCTAPCGSGSAAHRPAGRWPERTPWTEGLPVLLSLLYLQEDPGGQVLLVSLENPGFLGLLELQGSLWFLAVPAGLLVRLFPSVLSLLVVRPSPWLQVDQELPEFLVVRLLLSVPVLLDRPAVR